MHVGLVLPATVDISIHDSVVRTAQEALICLSVHVFSMGPALALSQRIPKPGSRGPRSTLVLAASGSVSIIEGSGHELPLRESRYVPSASAHTALAELLASSQEIAQVLKLDNHMTLPIDVSFAPYVYSLTVADVTRGGARAAMYKADPRMFGIWHVRIAYPVSIVLGDTEHGLTHMLLGPDDKAGAVHVVPATVQTRLRVQLVLGARPRPADNIPLGEVVLERPQVTDANDETGVSLESTSPIVCATARWTSTGVLLLMQVIDTIQRRRTAVELPLCSWLEGLPREEAIKFAEERRSEQERVSSAAVRCKDDDDMEREQRYQTMRQGRWSSEVSNPVDASECRRLTIIAGNSGSYCTGSWRGSTVKCMVLTAIVWKCIGPDSTILINVYMRACSNYATTFTAMITSLFRSST
jgi:hypothetical protein